jgi:hypothetical protein
MLLLLSVGFALIVNYFSEKALVSNIKQSLVHQGDLFEEQLNTQLHQEAK